MILVAGAINQATSETIIRHLVTLDAANPKLPINLVINSDGGQKTDAFAIIEAMKAIKAPVNTWATGNCSSAGAMVLVGGTGKRYATPQTMICVHVNNDPVTEQNQWSIFKVLTPRFEALWRTRAKLPDEWYPLQGKERWYNMTAREALQYRIVDEIRLLPLD